VPDGRFAARCYPNPFNPSTSIALDLPRAGEVRVRMYDVRGALVRELVRGSFASGRHEVIWDGRDDAGAPVASGVYVAEARALGGVTRARVTLVK
jgi:flagellar hook assembly protein FlgD